MADPERKIVLKLKCYTSSPRQRAAAYKFILDENDRSLKNECEFYELVAVRQGDGDFHYGGKVMPVVRNEVYLIPPHVPHYYSGYTHLSMLHFIFMPEVLEPYLERFEQELSFRRLSAPPEKGNARIVSDDLMLELDRMNICTWSAWRKSATTRFFTTSRFRITAASRGMAPTIARTRAGSVWDAG